MIKTVKSVLSYDRKLTKDEIELIRDRGDTIQALMRREYKRDNRTYRWRKLYTISCLKQLMDDYREMRRKQIEGLPL